MRLSHLKTFPFTKHLYTGASNFNLIFQMKVNNEVIDELICNLVGEDVLPLVHLIRDKKNVSEFKIAEQLNVTVNQVRNMLYRMLEYNLVYSQRKKDKKKGWYIYYWTINKEKLVEALVNYKKTQLKAFKDRLFKEQTSQFFICPTGCMRMTMENAMEHDFKCQECGSLLKPLDNQRTIENIKKMIIEIEEELESPIEIEKPKRKARKKKVKKKVAKKKVKKKKVTKKKVKKAKKKIKKKVKKKAKKKTVKKKVAKKKVKKVTKKPKKKSLIKKKSKVSKLLKRVKKKLKKK